MPVFPYIPTEFFECSDGAFSDHSRRGACYWHGGLRTNEPIPVGHGSANKLGVKDVPLSSIHIAEEWFQNRKEHFSTRSVENIVQAVKTGKFRWENMDPVTLWKNPDNKHLYMLSGHSRLEAFARLLSIGAKVAGRDFSTIPAKITENITLDEAIKIALESNTLSTRETDLERAAYYRKMRLEESQPEKNLQEMAKRLEGKEATKILAYSYLSPTGKSLYALQALDAGEDTSRAIIQNVARWIGNARRSFPMLTDQHENELYDWLLTGKAYGTKAGQISSETEFKNRLASIINRRTEFGVFPQDKPLNVFNLAGKTPIEQQYDQQLNDARQKVADLEKQLKDKIRELAARGADETTIQKITEGLSASLTRYRAEYARLAQNKGSVMEATKGELSLFGIGRICLACV